jgi:hypothetical protein
MKDQSQFENMIRDHLRAKQHAVCTTPRFDEEVLHGALEAQQQIPKPSAQADSHAKRSLMPRKITSLAAAAVVVVAVAVGLSVFHSNATPAYAIGQTVEAMKKIETVYMRGEFYKQGPFECWMRFNGDPDRPTHVWLGRTGQNLCKICSPAGVFGLNKRTNRVHFASRDERGKNWIPRFGSFFKDTLRQARSSDAVQIDDGNDVITIHIITPQREREVLVDAGTKLPTRFTTVREDDETEMMRQTLAVKQLVEIRYNEEPPAGIFDKPADAVVVEQEVDCLVDPDSGLVADGITPEEACLAIVKQTGQALVDLDRTTLCKLDLFFRLYPPHIWEQIAKMKDAGQWVSEFVITGAPYREGDCWYVPAEVRSKARPREVTSPMIRFYHFEGRTFCFIVGSKEKGVVD